MGKNPQKKDFYIDLLDTWSTGIVYVLSLAHFSLYRILIILEDDFPETRNISESDFGWT